MSVEYTWPMPKSTRSRPTPVATVASPSVGRAKQKGRTRNALLASASRLIAQGLTPTVADVADAADVSRRTAYRYFATQEQLLVEAALEGLRPRIEQEIVSGGDSRQRDVPADPDETIEARLDRTVRAVQRNAVENEALLRTMIRLTVGPFSDAAGDEAAPRRRGYRRVEWIELALAPARERLDARSHERLVAALAVCLGIDALIVLKDLCGLTAGEAESACRWMAQSLLHASLEESKRAGRPVAPRKSAVKRTRR